mmetsp:Transcript_35881/g.61205  ORF Transcript_35881/g.61205 Transcript_35881/m.61205 type:complete len:208 (+) Transcript_35881:416-1039(+)
MANLFMPCFESGVHQRTEDGFRHTKGLSLSRSAFFVPRSHHTNDTPETADPCENADPDNSDGRSFPPGRPTLERITPLPIDRGVCCLDPVVDMLAVRASLFRKLDLSLPGFRTEKLTELRPVVNESFAPLRPLTESRNRAPDGFSGAIVAFNAASSSSATMNLGTGLGYFLSSIIKEAAAHNTHEVTAHLEPKNNSHELGAIASVSC